MEGKELVALLNSTVIGSREEGKILPGSIISCAKDIMKGEIQKIRNICGYKGNYRQLLHIRAITGWLKRVNQLSNGNPSRSFEARMMKNN